MSFSKVHIWKKIERLIDYGQRRKMFEVVWSINKNILEATQRCMCKQKKMAVSDTGRWSYLNCFNGTRLRYLEWKGVAYNYIPKYISRFLALRWSSATLGLARGFLARLSASLHVVLKIQEWIATVSTRLWWCCCVVGSLRFSWFGWVHLKEVGGFMQNYSQIVFHSTAPPHQPSIRCSTHSNVKKRVLKFNWHIVYCERHWGSSNLWKRCQIHAYDRILWHGHSPREIFRCQKLWYGTWAHDSAESFSPVKIGELWIRILS